MALKYQRMRKIQLPNGELNITSLMDILTTLIFFIVLLAGFNRFFDIPANPLSMGSTASTEKKATFTLEVTVERPTELKIYLGPVNGLTIADETSLRGYLRSRFSGSESVGYSRTVANSNPAEMMNTLRQILIRIKQSFPNQFKAVVAFGGNVSYQTMIDTISTVRSYSTASVGPRSTASVSTVDSNQETALFPEVVISEWSKGA